MVLTRPTDVLFSSGKAVVSPRGKEAPAEVGAVLATLADRRFQVAGHTDNEPIRYSGYASNWELSSERALQVMRFLLQSGMAPATLSAAAYGEYDPSSKTILRSTRPGIDESRSACSRGSTSCLRFRSDCRAPGWTRGRARPSSPSCRIGPGAPGRAVLQRNLDRAMECRRQIPSPGVIAVET